jgi:hypothetical protein
MKDIPANRDKKEHRQKDRACNEKEEGFEFEEQLHSEIV